MAEQLHNSKEHIAIERLLGNAYETFNKQLLCISGRIVLWGAVESKDGLRDRYLVNKGRKLLVDRRHRLTSEEEIEWIDVDNAAIAAWEYLQWARNNSGQPIAKESLATYWSAFESCLKSIATAFRLASGGGSQKNNLFVPPSALNAERRKVAQQWSSAAYRDAPTGKLFFEAEIVQKNPFPGRFKFTELGDTTWGRIGAAYQARNAIVHSMGLATEQFDFDGRSLYAGDSIDVTASALREICEDFRKVLDPFRTEISISDL